jgi:ubiquinone/menaquinone biosynthesis C-methylase UbiE
VTLIEGLHGVLSPAPGQRLLEIGAGSGMYALEIAGALLPGGTIAIVDDQPRMLEAAMRQAHGRGLENISATFADSRYLPFEDRSFDAVYFVAALGRFIDAYAALVEIRRVLRPGGRIVSAELHDDPHRVGPATLRTLAAWCGLRIVDRTMVDSGDLTELASDERWDRGR